jgi:hypothetical protein
MADTGSCTKSKDIFLKVGRKKCVLKPKKYSKPSINIA